MKKVILALGCVALFGLSSCNKEKDCVCTTTQDGNEIATQEVTIEEGDCSDSNTTVTVGGMEQKTVCEEK